ncbi:hypothetical protein [Treponema sp.]|uniref:hypothetical protein n=1 Tax=Treponema sp. TaxID=166 RepID=UPI00298D9718|nr:hypothetical protein [Treponema sp.]MCR5613539.1 hypothetical protein [Treponema sp.]
MKKFLNLFFSLSTAAIFFIACDSPQNNSLLTDNDISSIYGWTYYGNITASSGNTLIPALTIYDSNRCDWNMNTNGMNNNQFYYFSQKNSASNYTLYWYTASDASYCAQHDTSHASMVIQLGINSENEIVILLTGDGLTGVSGMSNTRVTMIKQTNIPRNLNAPAMQFDADVQDISITIPSSATPANWNGQNSYTGSYGFLVIGGNNTYLAKGQGTTVTDSNGNLIPVQVTITNTNSTSANTVKITTTPITYTDSMSIDSFEISNVQVKKDGDTYYLYHGSHSINATKTDGTAMNLNNVTLVGKLENNVLTWRVSFKPGAMPFPIVEIFTSN